MAVTDDYAPVREAGNGVKVDFDANFPVIQATDVKVGKILNSTNAKTDMVYGVDYTVTINQSNNRPTVHYAVAPTALQDSWIGRNVPNTQTATIPTNNVFREVQVNNALDKHTMVDQQLQEQINRCIKLSENAIIDEVTVPDPENGKALVWDGTTGKLKNTTIDADAIDAAVILAQAAAEEAANQADTATAKANEASDSADDSADQAVIATTKAGEAAASAVAAANAAANSVLLTTDQTVAGKKTFSSLTTLSGGIVIETRTSDPGAPVAGQIWLRTDV